MSPIAGLSERRRLPRLGKIHLGEKAQNAKGVEYPRATDHFVVPPEVAAVYGETPTELDIMFPIEDELVFASQFLRAYSRTRGLVCKGDGERAARLIDLATKRPEPETGEVTGDIAGPAADAVEWVDDIPCPGKACPYYIKGDCRELLMLQVILPLVPGLGVWQLDTSSYYGMLNINSGIEMIRQMFGRVSGIPLVLALEPMEVTPIGGDGKKKVVRVLQLRSRQTLAEIMSLPLTAPQLTALPSPEDEVPELLYPTPEEVAARNEAKRAKNTPTTTTGTPSFGNVGAFLTAARKELGYKNTQSIMAALGVDKPVQITAMYGTFEKAWEALCKAATAPVSPAETTTTTPKRPVAGRPATAPVGAHPEPGEEETAY